jgi:multiple antibiotic resistance protein
VQVSGGIVIAAIGWSVLNGKDSSGKTNDKSAEVHLNPDDSFQGLEQKAFYPFTFPVTSGPGTLVVTLTLAARAQGHGITLSILRHSALFAAIILLSIFVYVCYANAPRLTRAISPATANGILRVVAFIVLCIGIQIAWNGLAQLVPTLITGTA